MRWWSQLVARLARRRDGDSLARRGERFAADHLRRTGYRILAANLRNRFGEIDLVAEDPRDRSVVIVEVKTTADDEPAPEEHVNRAKQRKLVALAAQLARRHKLEDRPIRFDVIGVVLPEHAESPARLTHHIAAFESHI